MRIGAACLVGLACATPVQADPALASERGLKGFITADRLPVPDQARLALGHATYADTCQNCHGGNKATGAPKVTSLRAWEPRLAKGLDVLIDHALNGFIGPKYTEMPPRGANPDLTDAEVAAAVLFMAWLSGGAALVDDHIELKTERDGT